MIADILSDLAKGVITIQQALAWINQHLELAEERGSAKVAELEHESVSAKGKR